MTVTVENKTKFGMYAPFDFEIYKKLKKIKAVANISLLRDYRYNKWARKLAKNRKGKQPIFCDLFDEIKIVSLKNYVYDKQSCIYKAVEREQDYCYSKDLRNIIMDLWSYAKTLKKSSADIDLPPINIEILNINNLYVLCDKWFKENY